MKIVLTVMRLELAMHCLHSGEAVTWQTGEAGWPLYHRGETEEEERPVRSGRSLGSEILFPYQQMDPRQYNIGHSTSSTPV